MFQASFRIYLTANLLVFLVFGLAFFPEGMAIGLYAALFSLIFSLPTLTVLCLCFFLLEKRRPGVSISWLILLLVVGFCAFIPLWLFNSQSDNLLGDEFLVALCLISALGSTLLQSVFLHNYFISLHYETNDAAQNS